MQQDYKVVLARLKGELEREEQAAEQAAKERRLCAAFGVKKWPAAGPKHIDKRNTPRQPKQPGAKREPTYGDLLPDRNVVIELAPRTELLSVQTNAVIVTLDQALRATGIWTGEFVLLDYNPAQFGKLPALKVATKDCRSFYRTGR